MNPRLLALASIREGLKSFLDDKRFKGARENFCKREGLKTNYGKFHIGS